MGPEEINFQLEHASLERTEYIRNILSEKIKECTSWQSSSESSSES